MKNKNVLKFFVFALPFLVFPSISLGLRFEGYPIENDDIKRKLEAIPDIASNICATVNFKEKGESAGDISNLLKVQISPGHQI